MDKIFYIITFESTHYAIMTEKKLKDQYAVQLIPTPRCVTASCGLSLKFAEEIAETIINQINSGDYDLSMLSLYRVIKAEEGDRAEKIQ